MRLKLFLRMLYDESVNALIHLNHIIFKKPPIYWFSTIINFGDILNVYMIEKISKKSVQQIDPSRYRYRNYFVIGSVLSSVNKQSVVWGAGLISANAVVDTHPHKILAVRGPLTRQKLLQLGIECPPVYGDPALLLPKYFAPKIAKNYRLGIIPHYVDRGNPWVYEMDKNDDVKVIDIQNDSVENFVKELLECEKIISSSLHGVIVADAYKIPSKWVELSPNVVGDGFKFLDYFLSVNRDPGVAALTTMVTDLDELLDGFVEYNIAIDLDKLLLECPFHQL